jgi:hypothetical protein
MKKIILGLIYFISASICLPAYAFSGIYQVQQKDIDRGYITEKIWLTGYAMPQVLLSGVNYTAVTALPAGAIASDPAKFKVMLGMDRKKPFAVVSIPAFTTGAVPGTVSQVSSFTLTINEQPAAKQITVAAKTTNNSNSVLANGTWHKIGITKTGFYTIDYNLLKSMGLNPATLNPANIRVFGNGGNMLSENNNVPRLTDLTENAIQVNDNNGNGAFDLGESAIFYAVGPLGWSKDSLNQRFVHQNNLYTDTAYYFITVDQGAGLRISGQPAIGPSNTTVNDFNYHTVHDTDIENPVTFGKIWYGEGFYPQAGNTMQTFNFNFGAAPVSSLYCSVQLGSTADAGGNMYNVSVNGVSMSTATFPSCTGCGTNPDDLISVMQVGFQAPCASSNANIGINFTSVPDGSGVGYLNYIEINTRLPLSMTSDQVSFRDWKSVGTGKIANYQLQGANGNTRVWDVTNPQVPVLMNGTLNGTTYSFTQDARILHEYAAMNSENLYTPAYTGTIANQNLHGTGAVDLIIVTNPAFLSQARQLGAYHQTHDHLRTTVVTTTEVYNEFSSGGQDISAIRDFAKMFYDKAASEADMPRYLLLFGGASYDYKNRTANNSNFVPVFESAESLNDLSTFCSDDFYGYLDDSEYIENQDILNVLDIGVGRLPARSVADATSLVYKAIHYADSSTLGPWRIASTLVADNDDGAGNHMEDAEGMAAAITSSTANLYNHDKVYIDAIPTIITPAGFRCPNANAAIDNDIYKGVFMINYNGHGNTQIWAGERILTQDDYNSWQNANKLPFMVTATCDFGQFDHPQYVSAAEQLAIRAGGGDIALMTTTQAVYAGPNHTLNVSYLDAQFARNSDGSWNAFGDAMRIGKNAYYSLRHDPDTIANFHKFNLLGDPALTPDFPMYNARIDNVVDAVTMAHADTVKSLGAYIVNGSVHDNHGNLLTNFNGPLWVTFYDKPSTVDAPTSVSRSFQLQSNIVYKGKATVVNGLFSFKFITPKDINYLYGKGKISIYAHNGSVDAAGSDTGSVIGGSSDHPQLNTTPPLVKPYINDSLFLNGGITGHNTSLYVALYDETGINVSGNNIGHDLTAVLDHQVDAPYILNDSYETAPDDYQHGYINFPISGLADGRHSITVTAWDVNDNVGHGTVDFVVVDGKVLDIRQLGNYPNPFTNTTNFVFEHNHPNEQMNIEINIFNASGASVKDIKQTITPTDSRTNEITWDGTDKNGVRLPSGLYIYRLTIANENFKSSAYQKLVIVR